MQQTVNGIGRALVLDMRRFLLPLSIVLLLASCSRDPRVREAEFLARGKKFAQQRDYSRALLEFRNATKSMPKDGEPYYQIGLALEAQGDPRQTGQAYRSFQKAVELNPNHLGAKLKIVEFLSYGDDTATRAKAEQRARELVAATPTSSEALSVLALTEMRQGKVDDARQHLEQASKQFPADARTAYSLSSLKLRSGDVAGAEKALTDLVRVTPKSAEAHLALATFYDSQSRRSDAENELRAVLAINPDSGPALGALGAMRIQDGQKSEAELLFKRASKLGKEYQSLHAGFLLWDKRTAEAIVEYERLMKADADNRQLRNALVEAYWAVGKTKEIDQLLATALKKNPKDTGALMISGRLRLIQGRYDEAERDLNQVLTYYPNATPARMGIALIFKVRGRTSLEIDQLKQVLTLDPRLLAARLQLAEALMASGHADAAIKMLDDAVSKQRDDPRLISIRNWALLQEHRYDELRKEIDRGQAIVSWVEFDVQDGMLAAKQHNFAGARSHLEKALTGTPNDLRIWDALLRVYRDQKMADAGIQKLREYVAANPKNMGAANLLGRELLMQGKVSEAQSMFSQSNEASPQSIGSVMGLAQSELAAGQVDAARGRLNAILKVEPSNLVARLMMGSIEERQGNPDAALQQYMTVIESDERNVFALNNAAVLLSSKTPARAVEFAQRAYRISPDSPVVQDTLGWALFLKGRYTEARDLLERSNKDGSTAVHRLHMYAVYMKLGKFELAEKNLQQALRLDPKLSVSQELGPARLR